MYNKDKEKNIALDSILKYQIKVSSIYHNISSLSGGNQQKVLLTRCILHNPKILILDEPTRGIDIVTKLEIYKLIYELSNNGVTIILITSEIQELLYLTKVVYVMCNGRGQKLLKNNECTEEKILQYSLGKL